MKAPVGIFAPDPVRGFPPGDSSRSARPGTFHAKLHDLSSPLLVAVLLGACCLAVAPRLAEPWATFTLATAVIGLGSTVWLLAAYHRDAAHTRMAQRSFIAT